MSLHRCGMAEFFEKSDRLAFQISEICVKTPQNLESEFARVLDLIVKLQTLSDEVDRSSGQIFPGNHFGVMMSIFNNMIQYGKKEQTFDEALEKIEHHFVEKLQPQDSQDLNIFFYFDLTGVSLWVSKLRDIHLENLKNPQTQESRREDIIKITKDFQEMLKTIDTPESKAQHEECQRSLEAFLKANQAVENENVIESKLYTYK